MFIFNLAPRKDGTWGAIVSRELYKAQKQAGAEYRSALARELERAGYGVECSGDTFRVAAIPRSVERMFSKRRQAIEAAAARHGYRSPRGMELAALRTRQTKREVRKDALFDVWRAEAHAAGFELKSDAARTLVRASMPSAPTRTQPTAQRAADLARAANQAAQALNQPAAMPGLAVELRRREREHGRG